MGYAEKTEVSPDKTRIEIERTLARYGADQFMIGYDQDRGIVGFRAFGKAIRFIVPLPEQNDPKFLWSAARRVQRSPASAREAYEQEVRRIWRALLLAIKAKLEVVESGIATFEDEFLAYIVLPGGETVGEFMLPQIDRAYETGVMPSMLPALGTGK